jgi:Trk K+ transport system NAD-binding subunit
VPHAAAVLGHAETRAALLAALRHAGFRGRIALTATAPGEEVLLRELGADIVLSPFADAADEAVQRLLAAPPAQGVP